MLTEIEGHQMHAAVRYLVRHDGDSYARGAAEALEQFAKAIEFVLIDADDGDVQARSTLRAWHCGAGEVADWIRDAIRTAEADEVAA